MSRADMEKILARLPEAIYEADNGYGSGKLHEIREALGLEEHDPETKADP